MCAGFPQEKPGKQDAKRIATFAYHLLRRRKRLIKKIKKRNFFWEFRFQFFFVNLQNYQDKIYVKTGKEAFTICL